MQIMPPRLQGLHAPRALSIRSRPVSQRNWTISASNGLARQGKHYSDAREKPAEQTHNMHVSEEAAATSKTKGEPGPELSQGTPIADVVQGDKKAQENLPKAVKENIQNSKPSDARSYSTMASRRTFSTSARAREGLDASAGPPPPSSAPDPSLVQSMLQGDMFQAAPKGPLAIRGKARSRHFHERYQNIVEQFVGLIMRDGKKAAAQRVCHHAPIPFPFHSSTAAPSSFFHRGAPPRTPHFH